MRLSDIEISDDEKYDAIIVDEGQDFKKNWFEILDFYLKDPKRARFVVLYDEKQDVFGHWDDLPWSKENVARKALTRNCRNTKEIIAFLKSVSNCDMQPFEKSPTGTKVVKRVVKDDQDEREKLESDVSKLLKANVNPPARLFLFLNSPKNESSISNLDKIGNVKIEAIGRSFREESRSIRYTNIRLFKGLESDVIFILGAKKTPVADDNLTLKVACSNQSLRLSARQVVTRIFLLRERKFVCDRDLLHHV